MLFELINMKRRSIVWQFYDKVIEDKRTKAVVCRLCDTEYKFLGNTTNLRTHLTRKHPLQWELVASRDEHDDNSDDVEVKRPKYTYVIETHVEQEDAGVDQEDGESSKRTQEEWLEDDTFNTKLKARRHVKTERAATPVIQYEEIPERLIFDGGSNRASAPRDQFDAFGEYVARRLRSLKSHTARSNVQQLLTTMLWQADFGAYEDQDSVRRALLAMVVDKPVVSYTAQVVLDDHSPSGNGHGETKQT